MTHYRYPNGTWAGCAQPDGDIPADWIATQTEAADQRCVWLGADWSASPSAQDRACRAVDGSYAAAVASILSADSVLLATYLAIGLDVAVYELRGFGPGNFVVGACPWIEAMAEGMGLLVHDAYLTAKADKAAWESVVPAWNARRLACKAQIAATTTSGDLAAVVASLAEG